MKRLVVVLALLLNGCALIDYYNMAKWDNNEYMIVNQIRTEAQLGAEHCGNKKEVLPSVNFIYGKSVELKNYSSTISHNEEAAKMSDELLAITKGLKERYYSGDEISQKYCELKFSTIDTSTTTIQKSLGAKPR
jgi:hypothetical protein